MASRAIVLAVVVALTACAGDDGDDSATTAATGPVEHLTLYYLEGEHLRAVPAEVVADDPSALNAVEALVENEHGRPTAIPEGTEVNGVFVLDRTATVDLSREFESGGGSASMQARVAQVVYTLTQWQFIRRVTFELDGEPVQAIGGEGVPARDVLRRDLTNVLPPIFIDPPLRWAASPLGVAGSASVFEGTVSLRLEADGRTIAEGFVTASEGGPGRGAFSAMLDFDVDEPTDATLIAFERSAEDGSETKVVRMPVRLCPGRTNLPC
jgi:germination protein M